jgi:hypothetical protein
VSWLRLHLRLSILLSVCVCLPVRPAGVHEPRRLSVWREQEDQVAELRRAVAVAGGVGVCPSGVAQADQPVSVEASAGAGADWQANGAAHGGAAPAGRRIVAVKSNTSTSAAATDEAGAPGSGFRRAARRR